MTKDEFEARVREVVAAPSDPLPLTTKDVRAGVAALVAHCASRDREAGQSFGAPTMTIRQHGHLRASNCKLSMAAIPSAGECRAAFNDAFARARSFVCADCGRAQSDPPMGMSDDAAGLRIVIACPWCSGSAVRERWEAEVPSSWEAGADGLGTVLVRVAASRVEA